MNFFMHPIHMNFEVGNGGHYFVTYWTLPFLIGGVLAISVSLFSGGVDKCFGTVVTFVLLFTSVQTEVSGKEKVIL